jgi:xanthine dehydrogenase YagS FAD-binding subunit
MGLEIVFDEPAPFKLLSPKTLDEATELSAQHGANAALLAGGCDLLDQLKHNWRRPAYVINLKGISGLKGVSKDSNQLKLGALTELDVVEHDSTVATLVPALQMSAGRVASPQIRNMATVGGNLLQDSRCSYYRSGFTCYRAGGIVCDAHHGLNAYHAIAGGDRCYTVTPSDLAPVMVALNATVTIQSSGRSDELKAAELFVSPSQNIRRMTCLEPGQVLTEVAIPLVPGQHSTFLKYAVRNTWDFGLASVAVSAQYSGGKYREWSVVFGSIAAVPWRSEGAEEALEGVQLNDQAIEAAAAAALAGAEPLSHNEYKVALSRKLLREALGNMARS